MNAVWLELALIAQDVTAWTKLLCLDGELASCEPKRLRYQLLHVAGQLAFHARQAILHLDRDWPWAGELAAALAKTPAPPPPLARGRVTPPPLPPASPPSQQPRAERRPRRPPTITTGNL